jgi:hypothetical protein
MPRGVSLRITWKSPLTPSSAAAVPSLVASSTSTTSNGSSSSTVRAIEARQRIVAATPSPAAIRIETFTAGWSARHAPA